MYGISHKKWLCLQYVLENWIFFLHHQKILVSATVSEHYFLIVQLQVFSSNKKVK